MQRLLLSALFCLCLAPVIKADEVVITSGSLTSTPTSNDTFYINFQGTDFLINSYGGAGSNRIACYYFCNTGSFTSVAGGSDIRGDMTYQGVFFPMAYSGPAGTIEAFFQFNSISWVIPEEMRNSNQIRITAPFTFAGAIAFNDLVNIRPQIFLSGQGTVSGLFQRGPGIPDYFLSDLNYTIGNVASRTTIQAVPEPVAMLLFGTGLVGVVLRMRRTRA